MRVEDNEVSRICMKYCPNYTLLVNLLNRAEQNINMSRFGAPHSLSKEHECYVLLANRASLDPEGIIIMGIRMNEVTIVRREWRFSELNLKFMHKEEAKWLKAMDDYFLEVASSLFTAGVFKLSGQRIEEGKYTEEDIHTL